MIVDDSREPEHGLKRLREDDNDDEEPLSFKHMKRVGRWEILESIVDCCALCPFGLTCQQFGMVWDAGDMVGWANDIFLVY